MVKKIYPVSPGELLFEEYLKPMGITKYRLAKEIHVPAQRVGDIIAGKRSISVDTDLRLCRFFGNTEGYWLRVQANYDTALLGEKLKKELAQITPWRGRGNTVGLAASDIGADNRYADDR